MSAPAFGPDRNSFIWLTAYDGCRYRLFKSTWEFKTLHQERSHLAYNFESIRETLRNPELVRQSEQDADCYLAYRKFAQYILGEEAAREMYVAVVVDRAKGRISTFYPCQKPKSGKTLWPLTPKK